jgi:hypothetical protein
MPRRRERVWHDGQYDLIPTCVGVALHRHDDNPPWVKALADVRWLPPVVLAFVSHFTNSDAPERNQPDLFRPASESTVKVLGKTYAVRRWMGFCKTD